MRPPVVLTIAGSDPSGGAGIQADIKTISALGGYAASVITAVTAQNTLGVQAVYPLSADIVRAQLSSVMDDLRPDALKIGMIPDAEVAHAIAACLRDYQPPLVVCDPVMISTSGRRLMDADAVSVIERELFPRCSLLTPNLDEAGFLSGQSAHTLAEMRTVAHLLSRKYQTSLLVKGGHLRGGDAVDLLCTYPDPNGDPDRLFEAPRVESRNLHGTGCTLSSAIATFLASSKPLAEAIALAKQYMSEAILAGKELSIGQGNGPLWHFLTS